MKTKALMILMALGISSGAWAQTQGPCAADLTGAPATLPPLTTTMHLAADGSRAATSPARDQEMAARADLMYQEISGTGAFNHGDIPSIEVFPAAGVQVKVVVKTNLTTIPHIDVSGVGPTGILQATLLLPVSGHVGFDNAKKWATTDTYHVTRSDSVNTGETELIAESKSLGFVTAHEVEIPLVKNGVTRIYYYRSGSGGPGGYREGRTYEIGWDGN